MVSPEVSKGALIGRVHMDYLYVADWDQHKHYRNRQAVWIKCHLALLNDYRFTRLSDAAKGQLLLLKLLAARDGGKLVHDPDWLARQIFATAPLELDAMIESGLLLTVDPASTGLSLLSSNPLSTKKEGRKEGKELASQEEPQPMTSMLRELTIAAGVLPPTEVTG